MKPPLTPLRAFAVYDGDEHPAWWLTTNGNLFTRSDGLRETVRVGELTWIANGHSDAQLKDLFEKQVLYCNQKTH
jgi:hypothetical protein